jgi:ribose 5-phosphate isomerase B
MNHTVALGCDPNAVEVKREIKGLLEAEGYEVTDFGSDDPIYANTAFTVASCILEGKCDRGILICGTGIGMSIAANKVKGIRAALLTDCYSAEKARKSNDAQIACFGAFTMGIAVIRELVNIFLSSEFDCRSASVPKVNRITEYETR